jgi:hypothetical protein
VTKVKKNLLITITEESNSSKICTGPKAKQEQERENKSKDENR